MRLRKATGFVAALVLACAFPSVAAAADRFAEAGGDGAEPCAQSDPCDIVTAVNGAGSGDDVTLLGGVPPDPAYTSSVTLGLNCPSSCIPVSGITVHGTPGARPVINTTSVEHRTRKQQQQWRDCLRTGWRRRSHPAKRHGHLDHQLRDPSTVLEQPTRMDMTLTATNVIARGGGGQEDIRTENIGLNPAVQQVILAAAGNFHQLHTSNGTIDLGTATGLQPQERDIDGEYRAMGSAPDIGADEFGQAPLPPTITGTDPPSGSNENNPLVIGTAEPFSSVKIYESSDCTGAEAGAEVAEEFASPGIIVSVPDDSTTTLTATATNDTGTSGCSAPFTYTEVSTQPPPTTDTTLPPAGGAPSPSLTTKKKCKKKKRR